ncbi:Cobinamide kinase / cobinamide phosphate guanyltransferase [Proteiniphilum saccharofermentans]|uniref:Adenosylcobinamide kinase n=1 Tax=Proteiniphilum saccharofermentans TaxID=1642647 RepID=A0A1R3SWN9_9BACT|nr:bifunctional adenosylcobinamide kinase/adenosylcobinamide-phosphate guanylyltransferase [Proteiniphilum saccharofermentans]SCD19951.1 Cobinamide kinase / cobinamide phosphate guanyltransferase [Proteiniphilum saccharofermentans]
MREIIFITGGQRSGKSRFAQKLAEEYSSSPLYLATSRRWDDDFEQRIRRHQADRGEQWETIEEEKYLRSLSLAGRTVLLDCITLWLTNIFHDNDYNLDAALEEAKSEWNGFIQQDFRLIIVSNEIGMGLHAPDEASRHFTDLQGWVNQHIAASADKAYVMVSGIPLQLK